MKKSVEILAPAGSFESMKAAVAAGADAVYMGGSRFGARAYADNPDEDRLLEAIDYVHLHGCRLYMTVNTLVKESELSELYAYLKPYYLRGLDAVIVQDMGVFSYIRKHFPGLAVHASTQMTITGPRGAELMRDMGASRIVTARELSLQEIAEIYKETGVEIESFVHGALCYCYSGQCLFSSLIGGRSGNRGRCAQTCRLPFEVKKDGRTLNKKDERYVLSLKDLCTLDILPDMIEAGVYSMKIEGRMKSPRYTAGVVSLYRKYADLYLEKGRKGYQVDPADRKVLLDLFDRGGQTEGYYRSHNGRDMVVLKEKPAFRQENRVLYDYLDKTYVEAVLKEPVTGFVRVEEGSSLELTLCCNGTSVTCKGQTVQQAQNQPMTAEKIEKQIAKTGNVPFCFEELQVQVSGSPFVPVQELNELRRNGFAALTKAVLAPFQRKDDCIGELSVKKAEDSCREPGETGPYRLHVSLEQPECLEAVLSEPGVTSVYVDSASFPADTWQKTVTRCHEKGKFCLLMLPHIYRQEAARFFKANKQYLTEAGFDAAVVRAWEEIGLLKEWLPKLPVVMDYGIYTMNREAEDFIRRMSGQAPVRFTLPVELNSRELLKTGCRDKELIVYGHLPVMVTAQCMKKTVDRCTKKPEVLFLKDRMGKEFAVKNQCSFCYNTVYNCSPLSLLGERERIASLAPSDLRLSFTVEQEREVLTVIRAFTQGFLENRESLLPGEFTKGHFKRGVE